MVHNESILSQEHRLDFPVSTTNSSKMSLEQICGDSNKGSPSPFRTRPLNVILRIGIIFISRNAPCLCEGFIQNPLYKKTFPRITGTLSVSKTLSFNGWQASSGIPHSSWSFSCGKSAFPSHRRRACPSSRGAWNRRTAFPAGGKAILPYAFPSARN